MAGDSYPVQWTGRQAVLTLPDHIDVANAGQVSEQLLLLVNRGAAELIVDMSVTVSCDYAGADAVVRAYQRAAANGTQLRLVVAAPVVRRVLTVNGLDRLIPVYPSLGGPLRPHRRRRWRPRRLTQMARPDRIGLPLRWGTSGGGLGRRTGRVPWASRRPCCAG